MPKTSDDTWSRKDIWLGLLFLGAGVLISMYGVLAARKDVPARFWCLAFVVGPVLVLLGVNSVFRALIAKD